MPQLSITQLPTAGTLTGVESVPVVQNGVTVQTTTGAIAGAAALNYPFVTVGSTAGLTQARQLTSSTGISLVDGGVGGSLQITLNGAALSLDSSPSGIQVKTGPNTLTARTLAVGAGLTITNADGTSGDPTINLNNFLQQFISLSGTGILSLKSGLVSKINILPTTNQISILNGDGAADVVVGFADNPVFPGTGSATLPAGSSAQRLGSYGALRYNTSLQQFEGYTNTGWNQFSLTSSVTSFNAGATGLTPDIDTSGAITLGGVLNASHGGTGASTLTGYVYGNGTSVMTASTTIPSSAVVGFGTMASQNANNVAITGGTITGLSAPLDVPSGGTGAATLSGYVKGTGTSALTASATIPNTDITGLGSMSTQSASFVAISGGSINGTSIGSISPANGTFTALASTSATVNSDTVTTNTATQTLTNKTLTSPTINTPVIYGGTINNAVIGGSVPAAGTFTSVAMTTGSISTTPSNGNDIVNKSYVDGISAGINFHQACRLATATVLPANTYNNGASGVGATLTGNSNGALSVDGTLVLTNDRVMVKNEVTGANNGIYVVTQVGSVGTPYILTRSTDYNTAGSGVNQIDAGDFFLITAGATNANTSWVQQTPLPITVGTTALVFQQFGAPLVYSAGTGLTQSPAYTFNIGNTGVTANTYGSAAFVPQIGINAQGQITSASNVAISIANTAVSGLGTMSTQNANSVAITGGTVNGTVIGGTTPAAGSFTTVTATSGIFGGAF
jgi:hypothetical protein